MDVGGTNPYSSAVVSSLGPIHGSFSGAQTDGLSSLQQSAEGLVSSDYLDNFKQGKSRKPYTISKQRERWSEEEHQRFVEAVKTYGRQWRKIEEHIGSKTAVQIRSHAQKFFNKLEKKKEAGEMPDKDEDIAIPPPRPKRKPSKPYPRKDGLTSSGLTGTSQPQASSQLPTDSQLPPALQSGLQQHVSLQQQQQPQSQGLLFQQQPAQQHQQQRQTPFGLPHSLAMGLEGLLHNFDSLATASSLASGQQQQMQPQLQQQHAGEVADATVAAVTAAASAAAAAAAAAVVAAAGQEVQMHMQAHPPSCFPFFGLPPSAFAQLAPVAPALDQAVIAAEQAAAATAAAYRFGGSAAAAAAAEAAATAPAMAAANAAAAAAAAAEAEDMVVDEDGARGDKHLVEATGTTDGTHISAYAQLRGSDGDSACSRETDNQDPDADVNMDVTWQGKLHEQQQHSLQHGGLASGSPAATSARALSGPPGGAFNPSAVQWGLGAAGLCAPGAADAGSAAAAAASMLSALGPAQVLALLSNPLYFANQHMNHQAHAAATGDTPEAEVTPHRVAAAAAAGRSSGGADVSSGGVGGAAGNSTRSKSRRTAPSVNSGSTGPPVGAKRGHEDGSDEGAPAAKKVACEVSDTNDDGEQVSPGSPSIQEKHIKAASQPSNTNGNTSGSNESDASKRRQGTGQGEGSNPNSVKDSNTATQTNGSGNGSGNGNGYTNGNGTNGNGTSAFHPLGHHHHAHAHGHPHKPTKTHGSCAVAAAGVAKAPASHHHAHHHHANTQDAGGEGSNGGNGMSGINNGMSGTNHNNTSGTNDGANGKDEGRSSSDLEGPTQQQVLQRHHMQQEQAAAEEDTAGGQLQQQQQPVQESTATAQLQALLANLHGMCGPAPLMQAYSAAAAAAAQQMLANALQHIPNGAVAGHDMQQQQQQQQQQHAVGQLLAALQQQMAQGGSNGLHMPTHLHAAGSQGFAPWHAASTAAGPAFGVGGSNALPGAAGHPALGQQSEAAASAQLAAAAAGLMGLGGAVWGGSSAATTSVGARAAGVNLPMNPYAQVAAGLQQQQQQFHQRSLSAASAAVAAAAAASGGYQSNQAAAAVVVQQHLQSGLANTQRGAFGGMSAAAAAAAALGGHFSEMSGLELLSRAAQSAGGMLAGDDGASGQLVRRRQARAARSSDHQVPKARQPTHTL